MSLANNADKINASRARIRAFTYADEEACIRALLPLALLPPHVETAITEKMRLMAAELRIKMARADAIEKMVHRFRLEDKEGRALMALAEALPRIPDDLTADALIASKLGQGDWKHYLDRYPDLMSKMVWIGLSAARDISASANISWMHKIGSNALREAVRAAMNKLGGHFVLGTNIEQAISRSLKKNHALERTSFDMLGEAARTQADADRYFNAYRHAIDAIGGSPLMRARDAAHAPSISVKLSALHPRYEWACRERVMAELTPRLLELIESAKIHGIGITIDAEEADRLELSLEIMGAVLAGPLLKNYNGFGCAVQAYQKRAPAVIDWLYAMAEAQGISITVRLVKGAYWDSEIKRAQERGLSGYPVYTRKSATDIAYLACARKLLDYRSHITPQFGSHNLRTILTVCAMAGETKNAATKDYEIQRLFGMGAEMHRMFMDEGVPGCVYAPVGNHEELLSYLIRRLMENSANTSFINQLYDPDLRLEALLPNPVVEWVNATPKAHPAIPLPADLYGNGRVNAPGLDLAQPELSMMLEESLNDRLNRSWRAMPIIDGRRMLQGTSHECINPANTKHCVGVCVGTIPAQVQEAMASLERGYSAWNAKPVEERCQLFDRLAKKLEENRDEMLALLCFEGGKTIPDAVAEWREAMDYCHYYAQQARVHFAEPHVLQGVSGEENQLHYHGRGIFVCISPWNFPLAIFLGQISAALLAGNTVAAKPAEQTPLIATKLVEMMLETGFPPDVIALLPGDGETGAALVAHPSIAGVAFTGSTETALRINRSLAAKDGPIVPLIAETGGVNALIADASALPEQVVDDVMLSAFRSAGQRCSAARLLCLQDSIADKVLTMLKGAISEFKLNDPAKLHTDCGPVIDQKAFEMLIAHEQSLKAEASLIAAAPAYFGNKNGYFFTPQAWKIPSPFWLTREVFGPILHVVTYKTGELPLLVEQINALGYGLTGGLHSRIDSAIAYIQKHLRVGNLYINRSIIGAVVGVQPFGGEGLSGTGPKAGGPHYLLRFASERLVSTNLTASGGNAALLTLRSDARSQGSGIR